MKARVTLPAKDFDWEAAKQRLARAAQAIDHIQRLTPERAQAVLQERAKKLSQVPVDEPDAREILEVVTFELTSERFAVETRFVLEVMRPGDITPLPGAAEFLVGVANLRGEVLAVIDLRPFFGLERSELTNRSRVIALGGQRVELGLLADAADEVTTIRIDDVLPPPGSVEAQGRELLRGVTAGAVLVLDGASLLRDSRLFIDQGE
jgi:purine-binding chemotaxis protein CheW